MNIFKYSHQEACLLAFGIVTMCRDFWHWHDGIFLVPWYRCTYGFLSAAFLIYHFRTWKKQ